MEFKHDKNQNVCVERKLNMPICKDLMPITDVCHASCQHIFFQLQGAVSGSSIPKRASLFFDFEEPLEYS